jgi:hypothetical protein
MAAEQVRSSLSLQNRACVGVKILKHHLRSRLHLLVAYGFRLIQGVSHNIVTYLKGWSTASASVVEQFLYWGVPFRQK